jgi:hypothetical protein
VARKYASRRSQAHVLEVRDGHVDNVVQIPGRKCQAETSDFDELWSQLREPRTNLAYLRYSERKADPHRELVRTRHERSDEES